MKRTKLRRREERWKIGTCYDLFLIHCRCRHFIFSPQRICQGFKTQERRRREKTIRRTEENWGVWTVEIHRLFDCRYSFWMSLPFQGEISSIKDERKKMEKDLLLLQQSNMFRLRWALKNNIRLRGILKLTLYLSKILRKKSITQSLVIWHLQPFFKLS